MPGWKSAARRGCLIDLVDDATSTGLARLYDEETTWAVAHALRAWVEQYGIPRALYVDWKNVYLHQPTDSRAAGLCTRAGVVSALF